MEAAAKRARGFEFLASLSSTILLPGFHSFHGDRGARHSAMDLGRGKLDIGMPQRKLGAGPETCYVRNSRL